MKNDVVVIGGMNMDIEGSPASELIMRDSNPGKVSIRPGGVGRNIAHNLRNLGIQVSFITAVGGDLYAAALRENCSALGMDLSMALVHPERRSSVYLYVNDEKGDMRVAVSDMEIINCLTPQYLAPLMDKINNFSALVMDANLPAESIAFLTENCKIPIYTDPVSTVKAKKLIPFLNKIYALKPNMIEAEALTGEQEPEKAAEALVKAGVKRAFISLGSRGMLACDGNECLRLPCISTEVVNTTGAGDAAAAAIVWAGVQGYSLKRSAEAAVRAGAITAQCHEPNNPELIKLTQYFS